MRSLEGMRRLVAIAVAAVCGVALAPAAPGAARAATCTSPVQITSLTFNPAQVAPGQSGTATITVQNCSDQSQTVSVLTYARFVGTTSGIPAGCVAIDPLPPPHVTLAPGGTWSTSPSYPVFTGCAATALEVTARVSDSSGAVLDTRTADLPIVAAPPTCTIAYRVTAQWNGGFVAQVTLTNLAATPMNGWTVHLTYTAGQRVVSAWDATVTQSGAAVTAAATSYNAKVTPGASTTFGLVGSSSAANPPPIIGPGCQAV
jgi:Cellulose binding domain